MKIYVITNKVNDKKYVGQTTQTIENRWRSHINNKSCIVIHRAIMKYGIGSFEIEIVQECNNQEELNQAEIAWIKKLDSSVPNGYNIRGGGSNGKLSEETKAKIRAAHLNRSEEWKANVIKGFKKRSLKQDWKDNLSRWHTGKKATENQLKGLEIGWKMEHTGAAGERNSHNKITAEQVMEIRRIYSEGNLSQAEIGKMFGITQMTVSHIVIGRIWKHLPLIPMIHLAKK